MSQYCVTCGASIIAGLACQDCLTHQAKGRLKTLPVLHCNFCAQAIDQRGTECTVCERARLARFQIPERQGSLVESVAHRTTGVLERRGANGMKQYSLWEQDPGEGYQHDQSHTDDLPPFTAGEMTESDLEAMRTWLLDWGARHGYPGFGFPFHYPPRNEDADRRFESIGSGRQEWIKDLHPPYRHRQHERFPGEVLLKCVEQVKRFDRGEQSIPWQVTACAGEQEEEE